MHHGTVSSADRLSQGVIAWPQVRRIPMKTSKKTPKKKNNPKKSAPAAGHGTPSPPRMDTLWGPRAGPEHCARSVHAAGRTPSYWPYDQVVTECLILRPRAMQVINCASWHGQQRRQAVARRDSMAARPANSLKQVKNRQKEKKCRKIGACCGPWDPISPPHGYPLGPPPPPRATLTVIWARQLVSPQPKLGPVP